ncbi:hypothetical protein CVT26_002498, partial [Gymnopilus dilepis]
KAETVTVLLPNSPAQSNISEIISETLLGISAVDVIGGITEYAYSEAIITDAHVETLGTKVVTNVLVATPTTITNTIEEGANFIGEPVIVYGASGTSLTAHVVGSGSVSCTLTSPATPGALIDCEEFITESGPISSLGLKISSNSLVPLATLVISTPLPTVSDSNSHSSSASPTLSPSPATQTNVNSNSAREIWSGLYGRAHPCAIIILLSVLW